MLGRGRHEVEEIDATYSLTAFGWGEQASPCSGSFPGGDDRRDTLTSRPGEERLSVGGRLPTLEAPDEARFGHVFKGRWTEYPFAMGKAKSVSACQSIASLLFGNGSMRTVSSGLRHVRYMPCVKNAGRYGCSCQTPIQSSARPRRSRAR